MQNIVELIRSSKGDSDVKDLMAIHYTRPKGFVGRQLVYKVFCDEEFVGAIAGGSSVLHLPGRNEFFGDAFHLNRVINNIFFHLKPHSDRNLGTKILSRFRKIVVKDWVERYGDSVIGFETLVAPPRSGSVYKADNWTYVGTTKGLTCKRVGGKGGERWTGKRVWDKTNLQPKLVFCKLL